MNTNIAAAVNGEFIYTEELQEEAEQYFAENSEASPKEVYDELLDAAIEETILRQQAEQRGMAELSAEDLQKVNLYVSEEVSDRYQYFYELAAEEHPDASSAEISEYANRSVSEYVDESGDTDAALREYYTQQIIFSKLYAEVTADVSVSDDEVRELYEEYVSQDRETYTQHPEYYESDKTTNAVYYNLSGFRYVKHILVSSRELAEELAKRAVTEDFETLMEEYSEDTAASDYIYGFAVGPDSSLYIDGFAEAALALGSPGEISQVIELEDGFHIIKYMADIPAGAEPYENVRGNIESFALSEKQSRIYAEQITLWREQADIDIFKEVYESLFAGNDKG